MKLLTVGLLSVQYFCEPRQSKLNTKQLKGLSNEKNLQIQDDEAANIDVQEEEAWASNWNE